MDQSNDGGENLDIEATQPNGGRGKRERKPVAHYKSVVEVKSKSDIESKGSGVPLGEITAFVDSISKIKDDDEVAKSLHSLLFGNTGVKGTRKKNFRKFTGFESNVVTEEKKNKVIENKKKWTNTVLKEALGIFGLAKGGAREELITRLMDFLASPSDETAPKSRARRLSESKAQSKKSPKSKTKKRRRSSKDSKGSPKKKRAPSAYLIFSSDLRAEVRAENPGWSMVEVTQELAARWNALDADDKKEWEERARAAKAELAQEEGGGGAGEVEEEDEEAEDEDEDDEEDEKADELDEAVAKDEKEEAEGDADEEEAGGDADGEEAGGDADGEEAGGDADEEEAGGDAEGKEAEGDADGEEAGGDADEEEAEGDAEGKEAEGDADEEEAEGDVEGKEAGGDAEDA